MEESYAFADGPRLQLDQLLGQLIERAEDVKAAQGRLRGLLAANRLIIAELELPAVLRHIVEAALELVGARYGALGVLAASGGLQEFVYVGFDEATAARIGHLPTGKGLLGAVIDEGAPIRLKDMASDARSSGFPPGHPPMSSFLGVPIRVRDTVFGNLYLAEANGGEFTEEDEELVTALGATAAVAIENAFLYDEARRRERGLRASMEITRQLLTSEGEDPLALIARQIKDITEADVVSVVLPTPTGHLMVEIAAGARVEDLVGYTYPKSESLVGQVLATGVPLLLGDVAGEAQVHVHLADFVEIGPLIVLPLGSPGRLRGALSIGRLRGGARFDQADLDMAMTFANHAAVALELADARADQQRVMLLEDRDRIARDLHDHVIQRLFAAGLGIQGIAAGIDDSRAAERLTGTVAELDETIRQIRTSIFQLRGRPARGASLRTRLLEVVADTTRALGFEPHVQFDGPIDTVVPGDLADDICAVLRESLTNVAKHAGASRVDVGISASSARLAVHVVDNGVGLGARTRDSGLRNLRTRAEQFNGTLVLEDAATDDDPTTPRGTAVTWTIPLS